MMRVAGRCFVLFDRVVGAASAAAATDANATASATASASASAISAINATAASASSTTNVAIRRKPCASRSKRSSKQPTNQQVSTHTAN